MLFGCTFAQDKVGEVSIKIGTSNVDRSGNVQGLAAGEHLYQGDIISTGALGYLGIELTDGTRFVLGKNTQAALKAFTVPKDANTPEFEIMVRAGAFRFKSSPIGTLVPATNHNAVSTSCLNIAVRNSELEGFVEEATGATTLVHQSGYIVVTDTNGANRRVLNTPGQTAACRPSISGSSGVGKIVGL